MRTKRKLGVVGALTLAVAVSVAGIAVAGSATQGTVTQSFEALIKPTKLPKKGDGKFVTLGAGVEITDSSGEKPPPATEVDLILDAGISNFTKGIKQCDPAEIVQLQASQAEQQCKNAKLSVDGPPILPGSPETNTAQADCGGGAHTPATVTAFNGTKQNGNPRILLHTDADPGGGTHVLQVIPGEIIKNKGSGPNRAKSQFITLRFTVPPLAGGACSIERFESTLKRTYKYKGEKRSFWSANCKDKTLNFDSKFTFNPDSTVNPQGIQTLAPSDELPCKQS
jgi:hypothetical protein